MCKNEKSYAAEHVLSFLMMLSFYNTVMLCIMGFVVLNTEYERIITKS